MPKFTITIVGSAENTAEVSKQAALFARKVGAKEAKIKWPTFKEVSK